MQTKFLLTLFFAISVSVIFTPLHVSAQEEKTQTSTSSAKKSISQTTEYTLPYPGMLPDSPIYKIKTLRDKVISFLITDPQKKVNFHLLQANKGILGGAMLTEKKNYPLAIETFLKAEHNMTLIPEQIRRLQEKPDNEFFKQLVLASQKHQEILTATIKQSPKNEKKSLEQVLSFSKQNQTTIEKYQKKNPLRWNEWN